MNRWPVVVMLLMTSAAVIVGCDNQPQIPVIDPVTVPVEPPQAQQPGELHQ